MITRRSVLLASSATVAFGATDAHSEINSVFTPQELLAAVKNPDQYQRLLNEVDLLHLLLVVNLWDRKGPPTNHEIEQYREIRSPFSAKGGFEKMQPLMFEPASVSLVNSAFKSAQPTASKIRQFLADRGVTPDKPTSNDAIRGFNGFVQMKAAADQKDTAWYCNVYPFSYFC